MRREIPVILVAILSGAALAGPASAADIVQGQAEAEVAPPPAAPPLWTGTYAGLYGSYLWLDPTVTGVGSPEHFDGLSGGGYVGFNYQFPSNWVAGIEGTAGLSSAENSSPGLTIEQDWEASLRGRMGYAFENSLIYGLAGLAGAKFDVATPAGADSKAHLGWQIGGGIETFLTEKVTARVEYNYSDFGSRDYSFGGTSSSVDASGHAVKLGVGFKF